MCPTGLMLKEKPGLESDAGSRPKAIDLGEGHRTCATLLHALAVLVGFLEPVGQKPRRLVASLDEQRQKRAGPRQAVQHLALVAGHQTQEMDILACSAGPLLGGHRLLERLF